MERSQLSEHLSNDSNLSTATLTVNNTTMGDKLAPYNPTSMDVVKNALSMLQVKSGDVVYDLGCGDARFLVEVSSTASIVFRSNCN
jgi:hypothetical protein